MGKIKVGVIVGSLRKGAFSRAVADAAIKMAPEGFEYEIIDISNLPVYNQDFDEGGEPASYAPFRAAVKNADAYLFVTPEHNRTIPAALKNALDIASRPWGQSVWGGKPAAIISISPGHLAGFGANHQLRQPLAFLNVYTMQQPEYYFANVADAFDANGNFTRDADKKYMQNYLDAFTAWIKNFKQ